MSESKFVIQPFPPRDENDWECQCARCGSSCEYVVCHDCNDGSNECEDCESGDCDPDCSGEIQCETCAGDGGWMKCLSSPEWCEKNPLDGRKDTKRGQIEWFTVDIKPTEEEWLERWEAMRDAGQTSISREEAIKRYHKEHPSDEPYEPYR